MTYTQLRIYGKYVILLRLKELCQFTYKERENEKGKNQRAFARIGYDGKQ